MQALALTSLHDRLLARGNDRIEIVAPRRDDARAAAGGFDWRPEWREIVVARDAERYGPRGSDAAGFMVQRFFQEQTTSGAHLEDRRGARRAYARADQLTAPPGSLLSISV